MNIIGRIRTLDSANRMLSVRLKNQVHYYYLERAEYARFERYLEPDRFIEFETKSEIKYINKVKAEKITKVQRIMQHRNRKATVYYDHAEIRSEISKLMKHHKTRMFLDLELSMHPYYKTDDFIQEIIQIGYVLETDDGEILSYESYVKPQKYPIITDRTIKFLSITQDDIDQGITAEELYSHLQEIMLKYKPKIYVWGKNDMLAFKEFSKLLGKKALMTRRHFIDLLALYKTYHGLKNDVGLFRCYEKFGFTLNDQQHHALEDAEITRLVYNAFLNDILEHN